MTLHSLGIFMATLGFLTLYTVEASTVEISHNNHKASPEASSFSQCTCENLLTTYYNACVLSFSIVCDSPYSRGWEVDQFLTNKNCHNADEIFKESGCQSLKSDYEVYKKSQR